MKLSDKVSEVFFHIDYRVEAGGYAVWIDGLRYKPDGSYELLSVKDMTIEVAIPGTIVDPMMVLAKDQAQVLMDDLWRCGLRPSSASPTDTTLEALRYHLEDMRSIANAALMKGLYVKESILDKET